MADRLGPAGRRGALVALALLVVFALVAGARFLPWIAEDREVVVATPSPQPLTAFTNVPLEPGQQACLAPVALHPRGQLANMTVATGGRPRAEVELVVRAPGYRHRTVAEVQDGVPAFLDVMPPDASALGEVCLRNRSRGPIELFGSTEPRTQSRPEVRVDGEPVEPDVVLRFFARGNAGVFSRLPAIVDDAAAYNPWFLSEPVLWLLALALLGLVPLALAWALGWAVARSEP